MKLIIGLGNPGKEHSRQRHNVGFMALDYFASANNWPAFELTDKFGVELAEQKQGTQKTLLVKPQAYMNSSGQAASKLANFYKVQPTDVLVVYDELALPFGTVRVREGGSSAGHNGVKSIIEHMGEGFVRLRIGIASPEAKKYNQKDFVLSRFSHEQEEQLSHIFDYTNHVIHDFVGGAQLEPHTEKCLPELI